MLVKVQHQSVATVATLSGPTDHVTVGEVSRLLITAFEYADRPVVLDLNDATITNPAALSTLLELVLSGSRHPATVVSNRLSARRLLRLMANGGAFRVVSSLDEAMDNSPGADRLAG